jgi:hypothetical protein
MVFFASDGSVGCFFDTFDDVLYKYTDSRNGEFTIKCSTKNDNNSRLYNLEINGFRPHPFCFSSEQLESYLSLRERKNRASYDQVVSFSEDRIVDILGKTGYGKVNFAFNRGKNNQLILLCRSTISYREIF